MKLVLALAVLWLVPAPAQAAGCWLEHGVVVVPASVAGVAGDYILDTGSPTTQLHETRAQMEDLPPAFRGRVRVDGLNLADRPVVVVDLDARTYAFPTPIAGVIGADLLSAHVVDVSFEPCRVEIWPADRAPRFGADRRLAMTMAGGSPVVDAAAADGPRTAVGRFVVATGWTAPYGSAGPWRASLGPGRGMWRPMAGCAPNSAPCPSPVSCSRCCRPASSRRSRARWVRSVRRCWPGGRCGSTSRADGCCCAAPNRLA